MQKAMTGAGSYRGVNSFLKRSGSLSFGIAAAGFVYVAYKLWKDK